MPEGQDPIPEIPEGISTEVLLQELNKRVAPPKKTYEEGLEEGKTEGYRSGITKASEIVNKVIPQADNWIDVYGDTPAGRAFGSMRDSVENALKQIKGE